VLHSYSTLKAILGTPLPDSSDELYTTTGNRTTVDGDVNNLKYFSNCMGSLFQMALNDIDDYYYGSTYGSTINCISGIIPEYGNSYRYAIEKYLINPYYLPVIPANTQDFINSTNNQIVSDCAGNVPFPGLDEIALDLTIHIERKITNSLFNALGVGSNCYEPVKKYFLNCLIGNACDPNEKYGQGDSINGYYLNLDKPISYTISFENDPTANLNAQAITVTDSLNGSYFDYSTFAFTSIVFSDSVYTLNYPATSFTHDFDFTAQYGVIARVTGSFDTVKGFAQWQFQTIDPATNLPTTNATSGILPPDTTSPLGQGYVSFIVKPNKNIGTGDSICNFATIVFDNNPPITTTCWQNYFDLVNPVSKVDSLPPVENNQTFYVNWAGSDNLSGIKSYDIYVSVNDSTFYPWLTSQTITTDTFSGQFGNKYSFYSIATDKAGNVEAAKNYAEATTVLKVYTDTTGTKIYPNPNQGTFVIQTNAALIVSNIALYDLYGEKMAITYAQSNNIYTVSLNGNVPFGMYILKIKTNDNIIINKVIVAP
jgi:hypothetical protein